MTTAVEWLINQLELHYNGENELYYSDIIEQANKMFEQQIIDAYLSDRFPCSDEDAEQYYNETFNQTT